MNCYRYNELFIGQHASFSVTITKEYMEFFLLHTGDQNPLHQSDQYAKDHGFRERVVFGMLSASFYSTLCGVYIPGKNCLLHQVDIKFLKPTYIGDVLIVSGKIVEKNDLFSQLVIKAEIYNQDHQRISKAKIIAGVLE